jgi:uncharacterized protein (DUF433 family)
MAADIVGGGELQANKRVHIRGTRIQVRFIVSPLQKRFT